MNLLQAGVFPDVFDYNSHHSKPAPPLFPLVGQSRLTSRGLNEPTGPPWVNFLAHQFTQKEPADSSGA